ncbi:hypothetical protein K438DRAFT_469092 [Mycena galopus ATCC 62051]|nr:hypothetical protein K438DRAFT_469092 [Mycena galopus ATCC 62051]
MSTPALFEPIQVGDVQLKHRVVLAPSSRFRATADGMPHPNMVEWYAQRASVPGTLLIAESTFIARKAGGFKHVPGIWSPEQIAAWKEITDAIHAKGHLFFFSFWRWGGPHMLSTWPLTTRLFPRRRRRSTPRSTEALHRGQMISRAQ